MKRLEVKPHESARQREVEANYFAMCLLMPADFIKADIAALKSDGSGMHLEDQIKFLAKRYQVSEIMMTMRLGQLGYCGGC